MLQGQGVLALDPDTAITIIFLWLAILATLAVAQALKSDKQRVEELKRENAELKRQLREETERLRNHYEMLLREAAIRNTIMAALYNAWKSGELGKCYRNGGEARILADGTVVCELPEREKSYAIRGGEYAA